VPLERRLRDRTLLFGLALIGALVFAYRGASIFWVLAVMIWPVLTGYRFFEALFEAWPAEMREVSLVRGVIATVAAVAILRETFAPPRFPALRPLIASTLAFCGVAGVLAFYNLGQPQFWNAAKGNW